MVAVKRTLLPLVFVAAALNFGALGCGEGNGGEETVYLYIHNAYPGADSMTIYGPTGPLVNSLGFGETTEDAIEVDRNVNSNDFQLVIDGAPSSIDFTKPLFSMYPQETGTLFVSRRAGESSADVTLYRHIRTPDPDCLLTFGNSLALDNSLLGDEYASYSYQTEWNVDKRPWYVESQEEITTTSCGYTRVLDEYKRPEVHTAIENDPWFFPVDSGDGGYGMVWGERLPDPRTGELRSEGLSLNGQVVAEPLTKDFMDCLASSVDVKQEDTGGGGGGGGTGQQECPTPNGDTVPDPENPGETVTLLGRDQVEWNHETAITCDDLRRYSGFPVQPGQPDSYQSFAMRARVVTDGSGNPVTDEFGNNQTSCGFPVRVRTPIVDLIFQNVDENIPGYVQGEGGFIEVDTTFPGSEQRFFVLYGRPVNAFIAQWNGEEKSVSLEEHPYPGELTPSYDPENN